MGTLNNQYQVKRVCQVAFCGFLLSMILALPAGFFLSKTLGASRLIWVSVLIGAVFFGLPLCFSFRDRRYYGDEPKMERSLTWITLLLTSMVMFVDIAGILNGSFAADPVMHLSAPITVRGWSSKHRAYRSFFRTTTGDTGSVFDKVGQEGAFATAAKIQLQVRRGLLGYYMIHDYSPE